MFFIEIKNIFIKNDGSDIAIKIGNKLENLGKLLFPLHLFPSFNLIPEVLEKIGKNLKEIDESKNIFNLKCEINQLLKSYQKKIIIFIDDIDRLDKESMCLIFRLVRLNADFDNMIYILAFDRNIVENIISSAQKISGRDYLEKIIQVNFDLPAPEISKIMEFLSSNLELLLYSSNTKVNERRWWNIYHAGFKKLFENIRDVKRFINNLYLTFPLIYNEINLLDFIVIVIPTKWYPRITDSLKKLLAM